MEVFLDGFFFIARIGFMAWYCNGVGSMVAACRIDKVLCHPNRCIPNSISILCYQISLFRSR